MPFARHLSLVSRIRAKALERTVTVDFKPNVYFEGKRYQSINNRLGDRWEVRTLRRGSRGAMTLRPGDTELARGTW